ncbi:MAG TPA: zf-HC2 domain-containing protein [Pyrinomonadaceae bacterium]|nr:zf-HC2 domain-containing protein [Pyrinomonadaceae bacterium]
MRKRCLEEGLLQAYVDGELPPDSAAEAAAHVAQCEACAEALATAAAECDFLSAALGPEESVVVPSEALRSRVYAAVARLEDDAQPARPVRGSSRGLLATLSGLFSFTPQRAAAFASVLAVVAFAAVFLMQKRGTQPRPQAPVHEIARATPPAPAKVNPNEVTTGGSPNVTAPPVADVNPSKVEVVVKSPAKRVAPRRAVVRDEVKREAAPELLPGEKGYVEAIASLSKTVELGGDAVLRPAARANYERNLAVVDQAIAETRRVARSNPRDPEAVSFLLSAYQSKVDLLTTVAEQAQVATLGR